MNTHADIGRYEASYCDIARQPHWVGHPFRWTAYLSVLHNINCQLGSTIPWLAWEMAWEMATKWNSPSNILSLDPRLGVKGSDIRLQVQKFIDSSTPTTPAIFRNTLTKDAVDPANTNTHLLMRLHALLARIIGKGTHSINRKGCLVYNDTL